VPPTPVFRLRVSEVDGVPTASNVRTIRVPNGTLTDDGNGQVTIAFPGLTFAAAGTHLTVTAQAPTDVPGVDRGAPGQTADLRQWQDSTGTVVAAVHANGGIRAGSGTGGVLLTIVSGLPGIWIGGDSTAPSLANYSLLDDGNNTIFNAGGSKALAFRTNNTNRITVANDGRVTFHAPISTAQSVAATTPGAVARKLEVFDAAGVSLGFIPIYDTIA
jgi:hypothetical protein